MQYNHFIKLLQETSFVMPEGIPVTDKQFKDIRDAMIVSVIKELEHQKVLHHEKALDDKLKLMGINLHIEECEKDFSNKQRIIIESQSHQQQSYHSILVDWQHANTASCRAVISVVEYQMQNYIQALRDIERALNTINPEIMKFLDNYPNVSLVSFATQYCAIHHALQSDQQFQQGVRDMYSHNETNASNTVMYVETKISELLNSLGGDTPATNMWMSFIRSVEIAPKPSALATVSQSISNDEVIALKQAIEAAQQIQSAPLPSTEDIPLDISAQTTNMRPS